MTSLIIQKFLKLPVVMIILLMITFGFVCIAGGTQVPAQTGQLCRGGMSVFKHVDLWKNTLLTIPRKTHNTLTVLVYGVVLFFAFGHRLFYYNSINKKPLSHTLYNKQNPDIVLFNQLRLLLARGILNPKIH